MDFGDLHMVMKTIYTHFPTHNINIIIMKENTFNTNVNSSPRQYSVHKRDSFTLCIATILFTILCDNDYRCYNNI